MSRPPAGAWIETTLTEIGNEEMGSRPPAGAWIETALSS